MWLVVTNSINSLLVPVFNIMVSYLVVRRASLELWGEFVGLMIVVQFGSHIVAWGNKEFLLRAFSRNPARLAAAWQSALVSRLPLFVLVCASLAWFSRGRGVTLLLLCWALGLVLYQSHEVFVVYRQSFVFAAMIELTSIAFLAGAVIWMGDGLNVVALVALFAGTHLVKALLLVAYFRRDGWLTEVGWQQWVRAFDWRYFGTAFPFFLLSFSGMVQSRVDLYSVAAFLPEREVARYQVFINLMLYLQSVANFILLPFLKTLYRLKTPAITRLGARLFVLGVLLLPPALSGAYFLLNSFYELAIGWELMVVGGLFVLPVYFYLPVIYALYKAERQVGVLQLNLLGILCSLLLSLLLLPRFGLAGALSAAAAAQWLMLVGYLTHLRSISSIEVVPTSPLPRDVG